MADDHQMPSAGRGGPRGRASLLDVMKRRNQRSEPLSSAPTPSPVPVPSSRPAPVNPVPSLGRGRAALLGLTKNLMEQSPTSSSMSISQQSGQSRGRASLLGLMKKKTPLSGPGQASVQSHPTPGPSGDQEYRTASAMSSLKISESVVNSEPVSRQGIYGKPVDLHANYIHLKLEPGRGIFEYEVKYSPDLDSRPLRTRLLNQHTEALGGTKVFDGTVLYLSRQFEQARTELKSEHPADGSIVQLSIIFKRQRRLSEVPHLCNILFRRIMHALDLVQIGRQHFNSRAAHSVPAHKLELWPGYITAIDEYEGGVQLCLNSTHRVLRTETVRDLINDIHQRQPNRFRDAVLKELLGISVLTRYNNKTYHIDDIDWNSTPLKTFSLNKDPEHTLTLVDYYKSHWNIDIKDKHQPLLVHRPKIRQSTGEQIERITYLIPELCYLSGLTEPMRQDFKLMKDVSQVTRTSPQHRVEVAQRFVQEVQKNEVARSLLASWGLSLDDNVVSLRGRTLDPEELMFGNRRTFPGQLNADWNSAACRFPVLSTPNLKNWCLLYCPRDVKIAEDFNHMLIKVGESMGMLISKSHMIKLKDDRTETFVNELKKNIAPTVEIMVIIFPTNRTDRYSAVKKICCVEMPIASQVIIAKTISREDKLKSVTQKIALQINCKLGGTLWMLKSLVDNCMVCGIDVHHSGAGNSVHGSVAGFVASLDRNFTRWFSKVCLHRPNQELIDSLKVCLISALKAYYKANSRFPELIIMYRDGVGDGQLNTIRDFEIKQLEESFSSIGPDYKPKLTVIIVQKRINTKIFLKNKNRLDNPMPGTIVDHTITRRNYYDFFLISQNVRQGTVSPTHYLVIHDASELTTDVIQRLTYKLCHLYYNWPGTVRVPAPCQYAHKLAFLVGQNFNQEPHQSLADKLFFL